MLFRNGTRNVERRSLHVRIFEIKLRAVFACYSVSFFKESFIPQSNLLASLILLLATIVIYLFFKKVKDKNLRILAQINLYAIIITLLIFTLFITVEVKNWYLYGTTVIFAFLITFALHAFKKYKLFLLIFLLIFIVANIYPFFKKERTIKASSDPAQLANQLEAINLIYEDAKDTNFSVYVFTPSIYDLHYQYLFWWQGIRLKKGLPADFSYLPNQPAYVRNKEKYATVARQSDTIYLIIENAPSNEFYTQNLWLASFDKYKQISSKNINNAIRVEKRVI